LKPSKAIVTANGDNMKKTYCIDIDGTICTNTEGNYKKAKPFFDRISLINKLYKYGHTIILHTARGSTTGTDWTQLTKGQLKDWKVKYHRLIFGKLYADYFVDDKSLNLFEKNAFSLKDRVAIVTGSSGDIGKTIVDKFRAYNAKVYEIDVKNKLDITNFSRMERFVKGVYSKEERIDILVNCAGITLPGAFETYSEKDWNKTILVNLKSPFKLSQIVAKYMKNTGGSIINITSLWSELGFANNPSYGASKGGLKQLTKCLAVDLAKYNIRVNNIGFGYIKTRMTRKSWKKRRKLIASNTLLNRWGSPDDVVHAVVFLASDASKYITGQDLYVDGGWLTKG